MAYYNFVFCTSAGDEVFYDRNSDDLMHELNIVIDGSNHTGTVLVEDEKIQFERKHSRNCRESVAYSNKMKMLLDLRFSIAFNILKNENSVLSF